MESIAPEENRILKHSRLPPKTLLASSNVMNNSDGSALLPWVEKYRPRTLDEVVSHQAIIQTLGRFSDSHQVPHLLFHGPPGTGKTSVAQAIAHKLYGSESRHMVLELNASDDRGIVVVRETIKQFAETRPSRPYLGFSDQAGQSSPEALHNTNAANGAAAVVELSYLKLIILDEADQMTAAAQMALRRIIEKHAKTVRFLLICNYVNKITPALQSRCTKFRFPPLDTDAMRQRTQHVCDAEGVHITENAMETLLRIGGGDMRKVLNCLQSATMGNEQKVLDEALLLETVGRPTPEQLDNLIPQLANGSLRASFNALETLIKKNGYSLSDIIIELYEKMLRFNLPLSTVCIFYPKLAEIQYRLARGADEITQAADVVGLFTSIRKSLTEVVMSQQTPNGVTT